MRRMITMASQPLKTSNRKTLAKDQTKTNKNNGTTTITIKCHGLKDKMVHQRILEEKFRHLTPVQ